MARKDTTAAEYRQQARYLVEQLARIREEIDKISTRILAIRSREVSRELVDQTLWKLHGMARDQRDEMDSQTCIDHLRQIITGTIIEAHRRAEAAEVSLSKIERRRSGQASAPGVEK